MSTLLKYLQDYSYKSRSVYLYIVQSDFRRRNMHER